MAIMNVNNAPHNQRSIPWTGLIRTKRQKKQIKAVFQVSEAVGAGNMEVAQRKGCSYRYWMYKMVCTYPIGMPIPRVAEGGVYSDDIPSPLGGVY